MSRQFRSDDTSKWLEGFGNGMHGDYTLTSANLSNVSPTTGSADAYSCTNSWSWSGIAGYVCIIHQTRGTNVGAWEINFVTGGSGGTVNLKYPLQNTYGAGAQIAIFPQARNVTLNANVAPPDWAGTYGGLGFIFAKGTVTITANANANNLGFDGAPGSNSTDGSGRQGEGTAAAGGSVSRNANGNGGGGGVMGSSQRSGGGGGGGHASAGTAGNPSNDVADAYGGYGGNSVGASDLTSFNFGGGGGEGANGQSGSSGRGGYGGGGWMIFAKNIVISGSGQVLAAGENGANYVAAAYAGGGGGGAGGSILLKGETIDIGTDKLSVTAGTGGTGAGGAGSLKGEGGAGSKGRINIDYSKSLTGSVSASLYGSYNTRLDTTIKSKLIGGAFLFNMV